MAGRHGGRRHGLSVEGQTPPVSLRLTAELRAQLATAIEHASLVEGRRVSMAELVRSAIFEYMLNHPPEAT